VSVLEGVGLIYSWDGLCSDKYYFDMIDLFDRSTILDVLHERLRLGHKLALVSTLVPVTCHRCPIWSMPKALLYSLLSCAFVL
jgi:hypothetical protein